MDLITPTAFIQTIIAPAVMISSCGLIFLALVNRYASINNRIRLLNDERRRLLTAHSEERELGYMESVRLGSIEKQLDNFLNRGKMLRNALTFIIGGIFFFVASSLALAGMLLFPFFAWKLVPLVIFLLGMISLFIGVFIAAVEIRRSFSNIILEVKTDE